MKGGRASDRSGVREGAHTGTGRGHRSERVAAEIHRALASLLLSGVGDPRLQEISITRVKLSPDLRSARIYFTFLFGEGGDRAEVTRALTHAGPLMRRHLARAVALRYTPELSFFFDQELAGARRVEELLRTSVKDSRRDEADD